MSESHDTFAYDFTVELIGQWQPLSSMSRPAASRINHQYKTADGKEASMK